jgi:hypothetical protein
MIMINCGATYYVKQLLEEEGVRSCPGRAARWPFLPASLLQLRLRLRLQLLLLCCCYCCQLA